MKKGWENRIKKAFGKVSTCAYCETNLQESGWLKDIIQFIKNELEEKE